MGNSTSTEKSKSSSKSATQNSYTPQLFKQTFEADKEHQILEHNEAARFAHEAGEHAAMHAAGHVIGETIAGHAGAAAGGFLAGLFHVGTLNEGENERLRRATQRIETETERTLKP